MSQKVLNEISKTGKDLMLKQPFYGMYMLLLDKKVSKKVPTAGVSKQGINYKLDVNEEFWSNLEPNHRIGLLHHELLHIVFFHLLRHDEFENQMIANIAMDLEINQFIDKQYLPPGGMTLETFADLNLEPKKGTRYYYDKLQQAANNSPKIKMVMEAITNGDIHDGDGDMVPNHDWEEFDNLSDTEKKLLGSQIDHHLKEIANSIKNRGTIPGELQSYIDDLFKVEPPKFDWKSYVRRFAGGSSKVYTKKMQRKENKRFVEDAGLKIKKRRHLLVAIDTSGSVSDGELKEFMNEIHHIYKTGSDVTILQCDTDVRSVIPFKPSDKIEIHGRGGTDFKPIIEYTNNHTSVYTGLIVFTDGEAPAPPKCQIRTLWVHSSNSNINEELQGYKIKLQL